MLTAIQKHLALTAERFGSGWNRFWFAPSDPASLGAVRIAVGLIALYWQLTYTPDLIAFFGADGLIPLEALRQWQGDSAVFTFFDERLSPAALLTLHFLGTAVLALFTLGLWTRITSVAALLVTLSYIHRGPMLTAQMEPILALALFYLCIGPSGGALSWDAWRKKQAAQCSGTKSAASSSWATVALRLLQVHITVVYVMMALAKVASPAWWNGSAIWWLIARPESGGFRWIEWVAPHLMLIEAWTHATVLFELAFPILIWNRFARPFVLLLSVPMWLLLAAATGMNLFALTMLAANLAFVSPSVIRAALAPRSTAGEASATEASEGQRPARKGGQRGGASASRASQSA